MKNKVHYFVETKRGIERYDPQQELKHIDLTIERHLRSITKLRERRAEIVKRCNLDDGGKS